jgi:hypothetical protein
MPLPQLAPTGTAVAVQETAFSVDALGRFVANTWEEATSSGPFTARAPGCCSWTRACCWWASTSRTSG